MATNESTRILDELLDTLDRKLTQASEDGSGTAGQGTVSNGDAIQAVLGEGARRTAVLNLRDAPVVEQFRQALSDGLIRVDTANRLLKLVNEIIVRLVP